MSCWCNRVRLRDGIRFLTVLVSSRCFVPVKTGTYVDFHRTQVPGYQQQLISSNQHCRLKRRIRTWISSDASVLLINMLVGSAEIAIRVRGSHEASFVKVEIDAV